MSGLATGGAWRLSSPRVRLLYVASQFPKLSETFVFREAKELADGGDDVLVTSLRPAVADETPHDDVAQRALTGATVPRGGAGVLALLASVFIVFAHSPTRALSTFWRCVSDAVRGRSTEPLRSFAGAAHLHRKVPLDREHVHAHFAGATASVAASLARLRGLPWSFTGHATNLAGRPISRLLALKVAGAAFVAAESEYEAEQLRRVAGPADRDKVVVVRNGLDLSAFDAARHAPTSPPVVIAVARLAEKKGLDTLLRACGLLAGRGVSFRVEIVGDGPLRGTLEALAAQCGIIGRVAFLGPLGERQVADALAGATVFALPCRQTPAGPDGLPVAITEALAMGVPVVTTPVAGIPEAVQDDVSGLLVPWEDPERLAAAIERLLEDPDARQRLAVGGRARAEEFDIRVSASRLRRLFTGSGRPAPSPAPQP